MPITGQFVGMNLDVSGFIRSIQNELKDVVQKGLIAYVEEAKSRIPVWAGASRAALTQIAGYVGIPIFGPGKGTGNAHNNDPVAFRSKVTPSDGAASEHFQPPYVDGKFIRTSWSSNLYHLYINDNFNANIEWPPSRYLRGGFRLTQPGPYELEQHCEKAVRDTFDRELGRLTFRIAQFLRLIRFNIGS